MFVSKTVKKIDVEVSFLNMKCYSVLPIILLFLISAAEDSVYQLDDNNFDSRIKDYKLTLVIFYIPWSEEYKATHREFTIANNALSKINPSIALLKVDCSHRESEKICMRFGIDKNVALKVFRNGEFSENYSSPKTAYDLVQFMKSNLHATSIEIITIDGLNKLLAEESKTVVVGFFEVDSTMKEAFFNSSVTLRDKVRYAHTSSKEILENLEIANGIVLFRPIYLLNQYEETIVKYESEAESSKITEFTRKNLYGLVGLRTKDNAEDFRPPLVVVYFDIDYGQFPKMTHYWRKRILQTAKKFVGNVTLAMSNAEDFEEELLNCDLDFLDKPVVVARDGKTNKYVLREEFSVLGLEKFVQDLLENKLRPYFLKSESPPMNYNGSIKIAVAENFKAVIVDSAEDVLVGFHSKWCAICEKMALLYEQLAKKFENEDIDFVTMDAFNNDVPEEYKVEELYAPTAYWAPLGSKHSPIRYMGKFEEEDLIKFIAKHATYELKGYDREGSPKIVKMEL